MLVKDVIADIRMRINDKESIGDFDNEDIVSYINQSITHLGLWFVACRNPIATKVCTITNGATLPSDFIRMCGTYPIKITGNKAYLIEERPKPITVKYFFKPPQIAGDSDTEAMPYDDAMTNNCIVQMTVLLLKNHQRISVQQDEQLFEAMRGIITQAFGGTT